MRARQAVASRLRRREPPLDVLLELLTRGEEPSVRGGVGDDDIAINKLDAHAEVDFLTRALTRRAVRLALATCRVVRLLLSHEEFLDVFLELVDPRVARQRRAWEESSMQWVGVRAARRVDCARGREGGRHR